MNKSFLRNVLPSPLVRLAGGIRAKYRQRYLGRLSTAEAFNEIYRRKMWKQSESLSGPGSTGIWAMEFRRIVVDLVNAKSVQSVADLGCGDFTAGATLAPFVQSIVAMDVSNFIIEQNKHVYSSLGNVTFLVGDICEGRLPNVDMLLVRQVLQHLTNSQVEKALKNIEASGAKYALIAEHIVHPEKMVAPNFDIPSHSVLTRVGMGSGVVITSPPFSRRAELLQLIEPDPSTLAEEGSVLAVFLMTLSHACSSGSGDVS
jgi:SAM-dependent methyltransferase